MSLRLVWRAWKTRFRDQPAEIRELMSAIAPGDLAIDVGSHKGSYLYWLAKAASSGRVVAFEPQPTLATALRKQCATLGFKNVEVEAAAVSDHNGEMTLHVPGTTTSHGASLENVVLSFRACQSFSVPVYALDDYFATRQQRVAAIKIDVEGHELSVLRGARNLLQEDSPCLVIEIENRRLPRSSVHEVLAFLNSLGYDGSFVDRGQLRAISDFDPNIHQRMVGYRYWAANDYCNNFVLHKKVA